MKKKIFAISDIHNNYNAMRKGLESAGYDETNPFHLLVVLGDMFDRKPGDAVAIYEYLKRLTDEGKAIVIRGNHESMLQSYLDGSSISSFNYIHNGTDETMADFWHRTAPFESWCALEGNCPLTGETFAKWLKIVQKDINKEYPELLPWIKSLPYYYETENYIFTHGAIDTKVEDWHNPHCFRYSYADWDALTWDDGSFFGSKINNTDKTIVIGHFGTDHLRNKYGLKNDNKEDFSILKRNDGKVIAIDATTAYSKKVNVLVIESEEIINE